MLKKPISSDLREPAGLPLPVLPSRHYGKPEVPGDEISAIKRPTEDKIPLKPASPAKEPKPLILLPPQAPCKLGCINWLPETRAPSKVKKDRGLNKIPLASAELEPLPLLMMRSKVPHPNRTRMDRHIPHKPRVRKPVVFVKIKK